MKKCCDCSLVERLLKKKKISQPIFVSFHNITITDFGGCHRCPRFMTYGPPVQFMPEAQPR